jgi:hypothetical protein
MMEAAERDLNSNEVTYRHLENKTVALREQDGDVIVDDG